MGTIWILLIPFLILSYTETDKKIKRTNELKDWENSHCYSTWFGTKWEIVDFDEVWAKLNCENKKKQRETKWVRIEDVQGVQ